MIRKIGIDTCILLAILKGEPRGHLWLNKLMSIPHGTTIVACPIVFAEIRAFCRSDQQCRDIFLSLNIHYDSFEETTSMKAGDFFHQYRKNGGPRTTILPDFLVAAHATTQCMALITQDRGFLRKYFPLLITLGLEE